MNSDQDHATKLRQMAEACRDLVHRCQEAQEDDYDLERRLGELSKEADRLHVLCQNALIAAGPKAAPSSRQLDCLSFVEPYSNGIAKLRRPDIGNITVAATVLETTAGLFASPADPERPKRDTTPRFHADDWSQVTITFFNEQDVEIKVRGQRSNACRPRPDCQIAFLQEISTRLAACVCPALSLN